MKKLFNFFARWRKQREEKIKRQQKLAWLIQLIWYLGDSNKLELLKEQPFTEWIKKFDLPGYTSLITDDMTDKQKIDYLWIGAICYSSDNRIDEIMNIFASYAYKYIPEDH